MDDHHTDDTSQEVVTSNKKKKRKEPKLEHKLLGNLWWFKLSVSVTATLLAFSLTLFSNEMSKIRAKKNTARNIALVTLSNIDEVVNNLEIVTTYYDDFRDMYSKIKAAAPEYNTVPDSLCSTFVSYIEGWDVFAINKSPELTFCTTFELWDYLEDIPLIRRIGNCYAYENAFLDLYRRDLGIIYQLSAGAGLDNMLDPRQKMKTIMAYIPFQNYMQRSEAISYSYHQIINRILMSNKENKEDMSVSDEDLKKLVAPKRWVETPVENYIFVAGPDR
jgi:hypothetical protein